MKPIRVGVTSENRLKIDAVKKAYASVGVEAKVLGYATDSNVGEQPINDQALTGARNRILDLHSRITELDRIVSIESGIFRENGQWLDKAAVAILNPHNDQELVEFSDTVVFPDEYVERACQIGFSTITVGKIMEEAGYVTNNKDPHLSISGISRQVYLEKAVQKLIGQAEKQWQRTELQFALPGRFTGRFVSDQNIEIGPEERLLLEAYVPGIQFISNSQAFDTTVCYVESDDYKITVGGNNVTLYDDWNGTFSFDAYHLLSGIARRHYLKNNLFPTHAACVGFNDDLILIVGHSGSGKTTVSMRLIEEAGMKLYSGNKTVIDLTGENLTAVAGTKAMTARKADLKPEIRGTEYGDRVAFRLNDSQYAQEGKISSVVLVRLNDGTQDWRKLSPTSGLHTLYPYFLDAVNADVVIGSDVFNGSVPPAIKNYLAERLGGALRHVPVYSAAGSLAFVVNQITGIRK